MYQPIPLNKADPAIFEAIQDETQRQEDHIELIASIQLG